MMRDDAKRCCLLSLLILSASLLVFLLCVRGCQVHGAPQADPVECFYFCGRGIGKMRPAVWNEKYSIYVCHCESWHTCWAQYYWSAGWAGERFSAQRPRDLGYLGMIWPFWHDSGRLGVCRVFQISWLATTLQDSSSVTLQGHRRPSAHCAVWHRGQWIKSHTLSRTMKDLQSESSSKWSHLSGWPLRFPPLSLFSLHWMFPLFFSRSGFS